jgi:glycine betaine transporter
MTSSVSEPTEDAPDGEVRSRKGPPVDRVVFAVAAALAVAFVIWGVTAPAKMDDVTGKAMSWVTGSFGWLFIMTSAAFRAFLCVLGPQQVRQHQTGLR